MIETDAADSWKSSTKSRERIHGFVALICQDCHAIYEKEAREGLQDDDVADHRARSQVASLARRAVEVILGEVGHAHYLPGIVAVSSGRQAAYRVDALDERNAVKDARTVTIDGAEE